MKSGKIVVLLVLVTALVLTLASGVNAAVEEVVWKYAGYFVDYIAVKVTAPAQASRGDTITIEVEVTAEEDLEDVVVDVRIDGTKTEGTDTWKSRWETDVIDVSPLDEGDKERGDCDVDIPDDADFGLICGEIHCEFYSVADDEAYEFDTAFPMTYLLGAITEEEYEALKSSYDTLQADYADLDSKYDTAISERDTAISNRNLAISERDAARSERDRAISERDTARSESDKWKGDYDSLKTNYDSLKSEYDTLQADYAELSDYKTYVYILVGTTILFVVTTIVFAVRKRGAAV